MKILIVDDSPIQCKIAKHCFKGFGDITTAESVADTVLKVMSALKTHEPFDLISMDYNLGDGTGFDAVKKIRNMEKAFKLEACKVIYVTAALDQSSIEDHCSKNEVVLIKPLNADKIIEKFKLLSLDY